MRVETHFVPIEMETPLAIIVDVLRATTMACALFDVGIDSLVIVSTVEEALELKERGWIAVGERDAVKVEGFDLGNSPSELIASDLSKIRGKSVVMTTTNGTKAVNAVRAPLKILASLNNLPSVVRYLKSLELACVSIICAGTKMRVSLEDVYCAGLIVKALNDEATIEMDDASYLAMLASRNLELEDLRESEHARVLASKGFGSDLDYALRIGTSSAVPVADNGNVFHALYEV